MDCTHHWTIATPAGGVARGACTRCGQERDFPHTDAALRADAQARRRRGHLAGARSRAARSPTPGEGPLRDTGGHP